jgi:hypothetical protein
MDAELHLDKIFYDKILDMIYWKFNVTPIMIQTSLYQIGGSVKLKTISISWDT